MPFATQSLYSTPTNARNSGRWFIVPGAFLVCWTTYMASARLDAAAVAGIASVVAYWLALRSLRREDERVIELAAAGIREIAMAIAACRSAPPTVQVRAVEAAVCRHAQANDLRVVTMPEIQDARAETRGHDDANLAWACALTALMHRRKCEKRYPS